MLFRSSTKDRLFETLETTTRLVEGAATGNGAEGAHPDFVVTDTVGFIRKLPTQLVHSFASTLEAARHADVRVLCADASSPELEDEISTVGRTLEQGLAGRDGSSPEDSPPRILCLNKMDLVAEDRAGELERTYPEAVKISARSDVAPLLEEIYTAIDENRERMQVLIPHADYGAASRLFGLADIHARKTTDEGLWMDVSLPHAAAPKYAPYKIPNITT